VWKRNRGPAAGAIGLSQPGWRFYGASAVESSDSGVPARNRTRGSAGGGRRDVVADPPDRTTQARLEVGFAEADITPTVRADAPVWLAGYYPGRAAPGVHDPLFARSIVLRCGTEKLAWVSVDLIGLQLRDVQRLRARLNDFRYVLVASTHNHEGPDVIGVWASRTCNGVSMISTSSRS